MNKVSRRKDMKLSVGSLAVMVVLLFGSVVTGGTVDIQVGAVPCVFGQTGFNNIDRKLDELKRLEIRKVILDYQKETGDYNPTWLTNERIANEVFGWYESTDPQPKITQQVIIDKYKEIINNAPPEPTVDETLGALFN